MESQTSASSRTATTGTARPRYSRRPGAWCVPRCEGRVGFGGRGEDAGQVAVAGDQRGCGLVADALDPREPVGGVAAHRGEVDVLVGMHAVALHDVDVGESLGAADALAV